MVLSTRERTLHNRAGIVALLLALAAMAQRALLAANLFVLPTDTGTLGLMALHILEGEHPLFLYGFCYSGAPLAYWIALFFRLGGVSWLTFIGPVILLAGLWVWLSYRLFRDLAGPRAGLAAALLAALPDYYTSWYTFIPDTSYGAFLPLVTLILWLAVSIDARDARGASLWLRAAALGLASGVALWCNAMAAPYVLATLVPLVRHWRRRRFRGAALAPYLPAALLGALALWPVLRMAAQMAQGSTAAWSLAPRHLLHNYQVLAAHTLPLFFHSWSKPSGLVGWLPGLLFTAAAAAVGLAAWWQRPPPERNSARATLPLVMGVFLLAYLPHSMADVPTPRYALPLVTLFLGCTLALPQAHASRRLRVAAGVLLACWLLANLTGMRTAIRLGSLDRARRLANRAELIAAVGRQGARHATLLGNYFFQVEGQGLSFLTRDRVRFVAASRERYPPAAVAAEREPLPLYVCQDSVLAAARASLLGLGVVAQEQPLEGVTLLRAPTLASRPCVALPPAGMGVRLEEGMLGQPRNLLDRDHRTALLGAAHGNSSFVLDLGGIGDICGLDLLPADVFGEGLPTHCALAFSQDGRAFQPLFDDRELLPVAYVAGDRVYLGGGHGRLSFRFDPVRARYLRIVGRRRDGGIQCVPGERLDGRLSRPPAAWTVGEVVVYQALPGAPRMPADERASLLDYLRESQVRFTACDRWLSAHILEAQGATAAPPAAWPLPEDPASLVGDGRTPRFWRFVPAPGLAVVVATALADEQEAIFRAAWGQWGPWLRSEHGHYTSFVFQPGLPEDRVPLVWNGVMLVW